MIYLNEEVKHTDPSPSLRLLWFLVLCNWSWKLSFCTCYRDGLLLMI